jgi:hypothetical protein
VDQNTPVARLAAVLNPADPHPDRVLAASDAAALEIVAAAREHRVSALLSWSLDRAGRLSTLSEGVRIALRQDVLDAALSRGRLEQGLGAAANALEAEGIPFLLLKGAALGGLVYAEPAHRAMTDVDILVYPDALDRALAVLGRHGFTLPSVEDQAFWRAAYYNLPVCPPGGTEQAVEIHWSIAQRGRHFPDLPGLFSRARDVPIGGRTFRAPGAADLFLHQALHHSYHYFEPKLVWIYDLALLHRADPPVEEIQRRARAWGMSTALGVSVLQVQKAFPGAAHPELLAWAERSPRVLAVRALFGARREPVQLIEGWQGRRRQLLLAVAMIDSPLSLLGPVLSWFRRAARHGDRAGHRRLKPKAGS